jgi:hypothetical protein
MNQNNRGTFPFSTGYWLLATDYLLLQYRFTPSAKPGDARCRFPHCAAAAA